MLENSHRAETEKLSGNQSFGSAEYSQAAVHYTVRAPFMTQVCNLYKKREIVRLAVVLFVTV